MVDYYIGLGDVAGNEFVDVEFDVLGSFFRPLVADKVIEVVAELQWFNEFPYGGGEFGEAFPHNPRLTLRPEVTGSFPLLAAIQGTVTGTAQVTGGFTVAARITENVIEDEVEFDGVTRLNLFLLGEVNAVAIVEGEVRDFLFPSLDPNVLVGALGRRPCFPAIVHIDGVSHVGDLQNLDGSWRLATYKAFRVSSTFTPRAGDALTENGALPNAIGMRVVTDFNGDGVTEEVLLFRPPQENEVIAIVHPLAVEKWDGTAWTPYVTRPQRAHAGLRVFEALDPSGVYDYIAQILGLKEVKLSTDTSAILDFIDPKRCPANYLPLLAANFGAAVGADQDEALQRETLLTWAPSMKLKGLPQAIEVALRNLGYSGHATHVWVRPSALGATTFQERPFTDSNEDPTEETEFFPSSSVIIHLNNLDGTPLVVIDDTTKRTVAEYLKRHVLPAHVQIRGFATDHALATEGVVVTDGNAVYRNIIVGFVTAQASPATVSISVSILPIVGTVTAQASPATVAIFGEVIPAS